LNIYKLSEIYIYPIKSLGGIPVNSAEVTDRGLKLDRRWMLVDEDNWKQFKINEIVFKPVKPCARCVITTVNQETAERGAEPLKTLSTYRRIDNNKVIFGMNLLHEGKGTISIGDMLEILE